MIAAGVKLGCASPGLKPGTLVYPSWNAGSAASEMRRLPTSLIVHQQCPELKSKSWKTICHIGRYISAPKLSCNENL